MLKIGAADDGERLMQVGRHQRGEPDFRQRHLPSGERLGEAVELAAIGFLRLAHDDVFALDHVRDRRRAAFGYRGVAELAFGDLDQRGAMTERVEVSLVDDAHVVVATPGPRYAPTPTGRAVRR